MSFIGYLVDQGSFDSSVLEEMNKQISETKADREPWVWIMRTILHEISSNHYRFPYKTDYSKENKPLLIIRTSEIMHHIKTSMSLRDTWNSLPIKSDRVLKQQLFKAEVLLEKRVDPVINNRKQNHMLGLCVETLEQYGLHVNME